MCVIVVKLRPHRGNQLHLVQVKSLNPEHQSCSLLLKTSPINQSVNFLHVLLSQLISSITIKLILKVEAF